MKLVYKSMSPQPYVFTCMRSSCSAWGEDHRHELLAFCVCAHDINTRVKEKYKSIWRGSTTFTYLVLRRVFCVLAIDTGGCSLRTSASREATFSTAICVNICVVATSARANSRAFSICKLACLALAFCLAARTIMLCPSSRHALQIGRTVEYGPMGALRDKLRSIGESHTPAQWHHNSFRFGSIPDT